MQIKKIKVLAEGLKGLQIVYAKPEEKNGRTFFTDVIEEKHYPIHLGLETKLKELRQYHAHITGLTHDKMDESEIRYVLNDIEIIGIKLDHTYFLISAKVNSKLDKKFAVNTPKVDEQDEYENFDKVQKLIDEILVEVKDYMSGAKKATDEDFGRRIIEQALKKNKETIGISEFDALSPEEKKKFCTEFLEKECGSLVQHTDDFEVEEGAKTIELNQAV